MSLSYLVNEIYSCLQGEGLNIGVPSTLVRFQICNLRCVWCDTPYTHTFHSDPKSLDDGKVSIEQNFSRISHQDLTEKIASYPHSHLIFSGGEPTLQNFAPLLKSLLEKGPYSAEVETNGTLIPHLKHKNFSYEDYFLFQWNVSPKFSNAQEVLVPEALRHWSSLAQKHDKIFFKFVLRSDYFEEDSLEILKIIKNFDLDFQRVLIMPEGTTTESQIFQVKIHDFCLLHGFRYTPRLHVILFGNTRGF